MIFSFLCNITNFLEKYYKYDIRDCMINNHLYPIFLDWNQPALDAAADFLSRGWVSGPLDLRDSLIIVPTRHAGRRLRERLAMVAAKRDTAVLIGMVETPSFLFSGGPSSGRPLAGGAAADLFWRRALEQAGPEVLRGLGREGVAGDATARAAAAAHLRGLRDQLCEEGFDLRGFAGEISAQFPEDAERWSALAALEEIFVVKVRETEWQDDVEQKLQSSANPSLPAGIQRVVMLFVPDPPPLALRALEKLAQKVKVEICVHAPEKRRENFDRWGRPLTAAWKQAHLSLAPDAVEVCDDAITVAESIRETVTACPHDHRKHLVVGVSDPQTAIRVSMTLARDGISTFDPSGRPAMQAALFNLVDRFLQLARSGGIEPLDLLLRHPFVLHRLEKDLDPRVSILAVWDEFLNAHLPASLETAFTLRDRYEPDVFRSDASAREERQRILRGLLAAVQTWLGAYHRGLLSEALPALFADLLDGWPVDESFEKEARLLSACLEQLAAIEPLCRDGEEAADMLRLLMESQSVSMRRGADDIDVLGWLELPWEDAPTLLLTDLNDGLVPESAPVDAFLPDGARARCGLRDNEFRLARDAYLLETLTCSRSSGGLRGFMARRNASGDLLKPSRLLFMAPPEEIPERALRFFEDGRSAFISTARPAAWLLKGPAPDKLATQERFSASEFRKYLYCPFRYYLEKAAKLGDAFERKLELDAMDFGNLVHEVFLAFAQSPLAHESNAERIEGFLHGELDRCLARQFGDSHPLALVIQRDVLRQRLSYAARVQAAWREEGWKIIPEECEQRGELKLDDSKISMRIDRIDRNERTGAICVIDYKTSQAGDKPEKTHLKNEKAGVPAEKMFAATPGGDKRWIDLQLPLYAAVARERFPERSGPVQAAYFSLPGAVADTAVQVWGKFDDPLVDSGLSCARQVIQRIRAGVFWPPVEEFGERDEEINLFFDGIRDHLDPVTLRKLEEAAR
jgi:ATP-dependent helicase/nuclease subunit B